MSLFRTIYWKEYTTDRRTGEVVIRPFHYRVGQEIKYNKKPAWVERITHKILSDTLNIVEIHIKNEEDEVTLYDRMINPTDIRVSCDVEYIFEEAKS